MVTMPRPAILVAVVLALVASTLTNLAYLREHDAAAQLPVLSARRPLHSIHELISDRSWLVGFAMESGGFLLYAAALALAPLALVQSVGAGGIGLLAFASARFSGRRLCTRETAGVLLSVTGLVALGVSLAGGTGGHEHGATSSITLWLAATAVAGIVVLTLGRTLFSGGMAVAEGIAGGMFFSIGDVSTKLVTQGGTRILFLVTLVLGYSLGTSLLQMGYQRGGALTVAGLATLLTYALPIGAGMIVLGEPMPRGALGAARILAFVVVSAGAVLLAHPESPAPAPAPAIAAAGA
jgi:hypothetical protein